MRILDIGCGWGAFAAYAAEAYGERFFGMWTYYLLSCAGAFRARRNQLWQIVFSRGGLKGGYRAIQL